MDGERPDRERSIDVIETQLAVLVRQLDHLSRHAITYVELDRASYLLARSLDDLGPIRINKLAESLSLEPTTVTRKIAAMEAKGLVDRSADAGDRRASLIQLSPLGKRKMLTVRRLRQEHNAVLVGGWSEQDAADFGRLLRLYNETIPGRQELLPVGTI